MAVELYTSSFLCVLFLVVFIPVRRVRMSVPHLAIILWLVCVNMIRGINALVWDGNVDVRAVVWCDIGEWSHWAIMIFWLIGLLHFPSYKVYVGLQCGSTCCIFMHIT